MEPDMEIALAARTVQRSVLFLCAAVIGLGVLVIALMMLTQSQSGTIVPLVVVFGMGQILTVVAGVQVIIAGRKLVDENLTLVRAVAVLDRLEMQVRNVAYLAPPIVVLAGVLAVFVGTDRSGASMIAGGLAALVVAQMIWVLLVIRTRVHLRANRIRPFAKVEGAR